MLKFLAQSLVRSILLIFLILPSFLIFFLIENNNTINLEPGKPIVLPAKAEQVHDFIPRTRWGDLSTCGEHFDERLNYDLAVSCVNKKVWPDSQISHTLLPRCFVVTAASDDVFYTNGFNGIPIVDPFSGDIGSVVGFYDPETMTIFVVENIDAPRIYRHELQHFFLHLHDPESFGGGHYQEIWQQCEEPYYTPSLLAELQSVLESNKKD